MKSNYVHDKKGFGMPHVDPLTIVQAWQEAANAQNYDSLNAALEAAGLDQSME